ncbi:MAG: YifB family Mg chelatase-like AAA ATPase [Clostridia bacterium]|nr:YifB family Mg chelatase-like AAA ATPase [Clostridia bacterium]
MLAIVNSCCVIGLINHIVRVEVDVSNGLPYFEIVGLPDTSVRESRDRVRTALKNSGFDFPLHRITVNLSPGNLKKEGPMYDLPIAIGILAATGQVDTTSITDKVFVGELSLNGEILDVSGVLVMTDSLSRESGKTNYSLVTSVNNGKEGAIINNISVYGFPTIPALVEFISGNHSIEPVIYNPNSVEVSQPSLDYKDVNGQFEAKRALEIAAGGLHNIIMSGPPGSGKTMLAERFNTILPKLSNEEKIQITKIYSVAGLLPVKSPLITKRPFIAPHHTCSLASMVGGGKFPKPGLLSLASYGVIFLDELPEFSRDILESLRQPLEEHQLKIARLSTAVTYPANFQLIAALNPCPCGYHGHPNKPCTCSSIQQARYLKKISGPLLDRIDIQIQLPPVEFEQLYSASQSKSSTSQEIQSRVIKARERQQSRWSQYDAPYLANGLVSSLQLKKEITLTKECRQLLKTAFIKLNLTARSHDKILRIALTIADLDNSDSISVDHISEAIQFRRLDHQWTN